MRLEHIDVSGNWIWNIFNFEMVERLIILPWFQKVGPLEFLELLEKIILDFSNEILIVHYTPLISVFRPGYIPVGISDHRDILVGNFGHRDIPVGNFVHRDIPVGNFGHRDGIPVDFGIFRWKSRPHRNTETGVSLWLGNIENLKGGVYLLRR